MRRAGTIQALMLLSIITLLTRPVARLGAQTGGLSVGVSKTEAGRTLYNVRADGVEIAEVLKLLFNKVGEEFSIDPTVQGRLYLSIRDATFEQVLERVAEVAQPPIRIRRVGKVYRVTRNVEAEQRAEVARERMERLHGGGIHVPMGYQALALNRTVSLDIPDQRPIALGQALRLIGQQTQTTIRLDKSIRSDIRFSARFTRTPLQFVLDSIAKTGALKWAFLSDGSILIAPADRWSLIAGGNVAIGYPSQVCPRCRQSVYVSWNYCPRCGQSMPKRALPNDRRSPR